MLVHLCTVHSVTCSLTRATLFLRHALGGMLGFVRTRTSYMIMSGHVVLDLLNEFGKSYTMRGLPRERA